MIHIPIWLIVIVLIAVLAILILQSSKRRDLAAVILALEDSVQTAKGQRDHESERACAQVGELETVRTQFEASEKARKAEDVAGAGRIVELESELTASKDVAALLKQDKAELEARLAEAKENNERDLEVNTALTARNATLEGQVTQLRSDVTDRNSKIKVQKEKLDKLNGKAVAARPRKKKA